MRIELQILMIFFALSFLLFVVKVSKRNLLNVKFAVLWIIGGLGVLILSVFPSLLELASIIFQISTPVTTLFFISISILYVFVFYVFVKISFLENRINNLTYENSVLRKKISDKFKKNKNES